MNSEQLDQLFAALSKAQAAIGVAHRDSTNPHYKSQYADLASVWDAFRGPMTENGLCLIQSVEVRQDEGGPPAVLRSVLGHVSGQWIASEYPLYPPPRPVKDQSGAVIAWVHNDPQEIGKAVTYARRYAAQALLGVCPGDDDGNSLSANAEAAARAAASQAARTPPAREPAGPVMPAPPSMITPSQKGRLVALANSHHPRGAELLEWALRVRYFPQEPAKSFSWKKVTREMQDGITQALGDENRRKLMIERFEADMPAEAPAPEPDPAELVS